MTMKAAAILAAAALFAAPGANAAPSTTPDAAAGDAQTPRIDFENLHFDPVAAAEAVPLLIEGMKIYANVSKRMAAHEAELAKRGVAEEPASKAALRYSVDTGLAGNVLFDDWGELFIDRRFVTKEEMETVRKIELFVRKHVIEPIQEAKGIRPPPPRVHAGDKGLPVFRGFEDACYQQHDALIAKMVADFNAHKAEWCGGTPGQAGGVADVSAAMVKAHMIEESGGNGPSSKAAWLVDPLQVNVPGDWGREKELVGLSKPSKRHEGSLEKNVRAAIMYLSRKGFGASARPASERPKGFFDGWPKALQRYNGRRDRTATDRWYSEEYAEKIMRRAADPDVFVPIEIKMKK